VQAPTLRDQEHLSVVKIFQGTLTAGSAGGRFAIVVSRFNESITSRLLEGAINTLTSHGVGEERIDVAWVPGAFEIPTVAGELAASGRYVAVICLGAVIRGETTHDQHINRAVSNTLAEIGVHYSLPVLFGVLTCNTLEQAVARSGGDAATTGKDHAEKRIGNKGVDCANAALEMVDLMAQLRKEFK
jgi:6,7-dimethyl-8-ribityllumazine synthase